MSNPSPEPAPPIPPRSPPLLSGRRGAAAIGFATALIVFGLLIVTGPFWAPAIVPLFSGGAAPSEPGLADRVAQLEAAQREYQQTTSQAIAAVQKTTADTAAAVQRLERRIAALENQPRVAANDLGELQKEVKNLEARLTAAASDIGDIRQQIEKLAAASTEVSTRVATLEKSEQAQSAADPSDIALLLTLLQIREAIDVARPFAAEYDALAGLARSRPDIAAAVAPLAEPAKTGVASRALLAERLHALAGTIATAKTPPADADWGGQAWARLRGLVTIRRIDGAGQSGPEAAISTAERSLAAGDLPGAVAALEPLTGPPADAARPWLQMARQRLAVETALHQLEGLLVARLGVAR